MLGTTKLERLCIEQLGGGPWQFWEHPPDSLQKYFMATRYAHGFQILSEPEFIVRRWVGGRDWDKELNQWATTWGPLYVKGTSWEDCARQLGLQLPEGKSIH